MTLQIRMNSKLSNQECKNLTWTDIEKAFLVLSKGKFFPFYILHPILHASSLPPSWHARPKFLDTSLWANIWLTSCIAEHSRQVWFQWNTIEWDSGSWKVEFYKEMSSEMVCYWRSLSWLLLSALLPHPLHLSQHLSLFLFLTLSHTDTVPSTRVQQGNTRSFFCLLSAKWVFPTVLLVFAMSHSS